MVYIEDKKLNKHKNISSKVSYFDAYNLSFMTSKENAICWIFDIIILIGTIFAHSQEVLTITIFTLISVFFYGMIDIINRSQNINKVFDKKKQEFENKVKNGH